MMSHRCMTAAAMAVTAAMTATGLAQDAAAGKFETTVALGVTLTDGNSETTQANASILAAGERAKLGSVRFGAEANYAESTVSSNSQTTVENAKAFAGARKTLSEKTFAALDATALYDDVADLDYRFTIGPGLGVYLLKSDATKLSTEAGVTFVSEKLGGVSNEYAALRLAERFERQLSATAKLWQSAEYVSQIDDFDKYFVNAEIGVEAALNSHLSLRVVVQDKYESLPAAGREHNDVTIIAGLSMKL